MNSLFAFKFRPSVDLSWMVFFSGIIFAWAALFLMTSGLPSDEFTNLYGAEFWIELCQASVTQAGYGGLFIMWALMSAAMMMPTFVPTLSVFRDLSSVGATGSQSFAALIAGYVLIWLGFSSLAAGAQILLFEYGYVSVLGTSQSGVFNAILLAGAGFYQFSTLKQGCLSKCQTPLTFFMSSFEAGNIGAVKMGLRLGVICLGCCWALMALAFVGGTMNLIWMGLATMIMVFEKLPDFGKYVTKPLGIVLIAGAAYSGLTVFL